MILVVLYGASGSGKSYMEQFLVNKKGFSKLVTYTTRQPREGEVHGVHYNFISRDNFLELITDLEMVAVTSYYGNKNLYGVSLKSLLSMRDSGVNNAVVVLDKRGLLLLSDIINTKLKELGIETHIVHVKRDPHDCFQAQLDRGSSVKEALIRYDRDMKDHYFDKGVYSLEGGTSLYHTVDNDGTFNFETSIDNLLKYSIGCE